MPGLGTDPWAAVVLRGACLAMVGLFTGVLSAGEPLAPDPKEQFKMLLQSPPEIELLLFREKLPPILNQPVPRDGISGSTNYAHFELRWKSNAMSVRRIEATNDPATGNVPKVAFSLLNNNFWFLDAGKNAFLYHLEHARARRGEVPPAYDAAWFRVTRYGEFLNLGLSHLWPGSVRWHGDTFAAQGIADKKPIYVSGEISKTTNGIPCELTVAYSNNMGVARYRISYEYQTYVPPYYPSRVSLHWKGASKEIEYRTYDLLAVRAAVKTTPDEAFAPALLMRKMGMSLRYFTNDSIYMRLSSGKFLETPGETPKLSLNQADYYRNRYFYAASALLGAVFLALGVKAKPSPNHKGGTS